MNADAKPCGHFDAAPITYVASGTVRTDCRDCFNRKTQRDIIARADDDRRRP
jgi:hypothetical protein